jgi:putative inorganic carbon (hco3(-)) transporter
MPNSEPWIERAGFVSFLVLVFSLGSMKPPIYSPFGPVTLTDLLLIICLMFVALAMIFGKFRLRSHPAFLMLSLFLLANTVSAIFSADVPRSIIKLIGSSYLVVLSVVAFTFVSTLERFRATILVWIAGASIPMLVALSAIVLFYLAPGNTWLADVTYHYGAVPVGTFPRVSSTMVTPGMLCNYLTVTLLLVLIAVRMEWMGKKLGVAAVFAIAVASVFTVSMMLGGFMLAAGLWLWRISEEKTTSRIALAAASISAIAFLAIAPVSINDAIAGTIAPSSRLLVWSDAVRTFLENPILGNGPGLPVASVVYENSDGSISLLTDAHNTFLNVAGQTGTLGLAGLLAVIFAVIRSGATMSRPKGDLRVIGTGLTMAFVCAFLYGGLTGSFEDARHLWILIGLIFAVDSIRSEDGDDLGSAV